MAGKPLQLGEECERYFNRSAFKAILSIKIMSKSPTYYNSLKVTKGAVGHKGSNVEICKKIVSL
jgi:hypothetical protein